MTLEQKNIKIGINVDGVVDSSFQGRLIGTRSTIPVIADTDKEDYAGSVILYTGSESGYTANTYYRFDGTSWVKYTTSDVSNKVDKVSGKGLSTNDFTTALKNKLDGIYDGADAVSFKRILNDGVKIGTISINGESTDLYSTLNNNVSQTTNNRDGDYPILLKNNSDPTNDVAATGFNANIIANPSTGTIKATSFSGNLTGTADLAKGYTSDGAIATALAGKADASDIPTNYVPNTRTVNGHALSSNVTVTKEDVGLGSTVNGAQINVIESVKVNGTALTPTSKAVDISVPTKTSDITNDSGFITKAVSDLTNYYTKSQSYTKTEIDNKISAIHQFNISVVDSLPTTGTQYTIYFVPSTTSSTQNVYEEYVWIVVDGVGKWEHIGSTSFSLSIVQNTGGITINGTALQDASSTQDGLMTKEFASKLDGIATGATKVSVDSSLSSTSTNPVQNKVINTALAGKASTAVATTTANGLMSSSDKTKLEGISDSADAVSYTATLTSGTKVGTITINGSGTDIYCQTNTDTKVAQIAGTSNSEYPLLMKYDTGTGTVTNSVRYNSGITVNPSTKAITATTFIGALSGNATSATTATDYASSGGIATALAGKQAIITGGATTIASSNLTASRALISNASGKVAVSTVTSTELGYLDGVTSNIQTQLNNKQASGNYALKSEIPTDYVPTTRTINSKPLSANITLSASDVSAVPTTRTVNGKALSANISLSASDVGALASNGNAVSATKATQDGSGNVITSTYATKSSVMSVLKVVQNTSITEASWVADTTQDGYYYKYNIAISGVLSTDLPQVIFSSVDARSGSYAPICESYNGGVTIYATGAVSTTIPTIIISRPIS